MLSKARFTGQLLRVSQGKQNILFGPLEGNLKHTLVPSCISLTRDTKSCVLSSQLEQNGELTNFRSYHSFTKTSRMIFPQLLSKQPSVLGTQFCYVSEPTEGVSAQMSTSSSSTKIASTAEGDGTPVDQTEAYKQLSFQAKLKRLIAEYGTTVVVVHMTVCLSQLGLFYLAVSSGLDVVGILKYLGIGSSFLESKLAAGAGSFAVAYVAYKIFFPLRFMVTLTFTPVLVRYLRRKGIIKPPKVKAAAADSGVKDGKSVKVQ